MLILSRNIGEEICIGDDIKVVVTAVDRYQVKLGIVAPRNVTVLREEIYQKITAEVDTEK
ncbi:carbon storage regulator CsrA [Pseudidiomarina marina]|uniref:Translational regulator CsrA n=1 Tax=Pseudidiomarina marina TaxID=502366 RepID=A0A432YJB7_9GAMM|nr:carbon storage regulator CsrA [Pseudidiomarina marina]PHS65679.1 MAG: carbon storage regulator [Alcanivorax sp.]RUO61044.1 carbon storage regulator [Pseudidiomarina marina]